MNPKPLISVIVPVYKTEKFLPQCIESILAQTYKNLEIILIDDGSPDNSGAICDKYAAQDKRIRVIHQANAGVSAARNAGLKIAKGEYIGFVDSDDYIAPDMYEYLYELIIQNNVDISSCRIYFVKNPKKVNFKKCFLYGNEIIKRCIVCDDIGGFSVNKLYPRKMIGDIRFITTRTSEDLKFLCDIFVNKNYNMVCGEEAKYYYVPALHPFSDRELDSVFLTKKMLTNASQNEKWLKDLLTSVYIERLFCVLRQCILEKKELEYPDLLKEAKKWYLKMLQEPMFSVQYKIFTTILLIYPSLGRKLWKKFRSDFYYR